MPLSPPIDNERTANIIGIDPGTTNLGLSVLSFDVLDFNIVKTQAQTLTGNKLVCYSKALSETHGDRFARCTALATQFIEIIKLFKPIAITSEAPFYNPRRPNAYGPLVEINTRLQAFLLINGIDKPIYYIPPANIKKAVGAAATGKFKLEVKDKVLLLRDKLKLPNDADNYDEHSVDAIATAYAFFKRVIDPGA